MFESGFETKQTFPHEDRWGDLDEIPCISLMGSGRSQEGGQHNSSLLENAYIPISRTQVEVRGPRICIVKSVVVRSLGIRVSFSGDGGVVPIRIRFP